MYFGARYGAYVPRVPPISRRSDLYDPRRRGYPTLQAQPLPVIGGEVIDLVPYPHRVYPEVGPADIYPPIPCPPGMRFNALAHGCVVPQPQYSGLGAYVAPDVVSKWQWDSFAVGVGSFAGAMMLGLLAAQASKEPHLRHTLPPVILPALGAAVLGYLLRYFQNKSNVCCAEIPTVAPVARVEGTLVPRSSPGSHPEVRAIPQCPEGMIWNPEMERCETVSGLR